MVNRNNMKVLVLSGEAFEARQDLSFPFNWRVLARFRRLFGTLRDLTGAPNLELFSICTGRMRLTASSVIICAVVAHDARHLREYRVRSLANAQL